MRERLTDYSLLADGGRTVTLVGAPGPISHQLEFHNGGEQRAILRQATIVSPQLETATGQRPGVVMPSVVLHPGQARRSHPNHHPDPHAAGTLRRQAVGGGSDGRRGDPRGRGLRPRRRPDRGGSGESSRRSDGQADRVHQSRQRPTRDRRDRGRRARRRAHELPESSRRYGGLARRGRPARCNRPFRRSLRQGGLEEGGGTLRGAQGAHCGRLRELLPGQTQVVELEITLPDKLEPRTRYTGVAPLYMSDLTFKIVPVRGRLDAGDEATGDVAPSRKAAPSKKSAPTRKSAS